MYRGSRETPHILYKNFKELVHKEAKKHENGTHWFFHNLNNIPQKNLSSNVHLWLWIIINIFNPIFQNNTLTEWKQAVSF